MDTHPTGPARPVGRFWDALAPKEQGVLRAAGTWHAHPAGTVLFREGEVAEVVLVLLAGCVKITSSAQSGHQVLLAIRTRGDILGELAAVDEQHRSATVVAAEPVEVLRIPAAQFVALLERHGPITLALLKVVGAKLRSANQRRLEMRQGSTGQRVAAALTELATGHGAPTAGEVTITLPLSQEEIAMMIGASREAVVRALRELRDKEAIRTERRRITVLRFDVLAAASRVD